MKCTSMWRALEVVWVLVAVGGWWREKPNASEIAMRRIFFFQSRIIDGIGHWIDSFQRHSQQGLCVVGYR